MIYFPVYSFVHLGVLRTVDPFCNTYRQGSLIRPVLVYLKNAVFRFVMSLLLNSIFVEILIDIQEEIMCFPLYSLVLMEFFLADSNMGFYFHLAIVVSLPQAAFSICYLSEEEEEASKTSGPRSIEPNCSSPLGKLIASLASGGSCFS